MSWEQAEDGRRYQETADLGTNKITGTHVATAPALLAAQGTRLGLSGERGNRQEEVG